MNFCAVHFVDAPLQLPRTGWASCSVSVDFDFFLGRDALVDEELEDVTPVVTLELDNVAPLTMLRGRSVAAPRFFEVARQLLHIEVLRQPPDRSETLPGISLLEVQVDEVVRRFAAGLRCLTLGSVRRSAERVRVREDELLLGLRVLTRRLIACFCGSGRPILS